MRGARRGVMIGEEVVLVLRTARKTVEAREGLERRVGSCWRTVGRS